MGKRIDLLAILGLIIGVVAILLGQFLEGGNMLSLLNGPALLIVFGGTLGAVMVETPFAIFGRSLKLIPLTIMSRPKNFKTEINKIVGWAKISRKKGILSLDSFIETETDPFIKKGLSLLVDGAEPEVIRSVLKLDLEQHIQQEMHAAKVFESMGGYAPTIGIIGAVIGLIHVMNNLSEPSMLGQGIAVAFVATIYGVGLANLFFLPMAGKLKKQISCLAVPKELVLSGLASIAEGDNPKVIEMRLLGFVS